MNVVERQLASYGAIEMRINNIIRRAMKNIIDISLISDSVGTKQYFRGRYVGEY